MNTPLVVTYPRISMKIKLVVFTLLCYVQQAQAQTSPADTSLRWQAGYLDIHHINTGRGNSTFFIFPDGTTMLLDAGDLNATPFLRKNAPLKVAPARPNDSQTAGQWIIDYVKQTMPAGRSPQLDYLVVSHFHADHYGDLTERNKPESGRSFQRTGITEVGDVLPVKTIIDRGYPAYAFPVDLRNYYNEEGSTFLNYVAFVDAKVKQGAKAEMLKAGSRQQIVLRQQPATYPAFRVQNVKVNGTIWTGKGSETFAHFTADSVLNKQGKFNENPLCMAFTFSYGPFDYFTGADNTGLRGYGMPHWFDTETPMAKAVGPVDVMTLNHHGNRDASNETFLNTLNPTVAVQQSWCSDQPGQEVMHRLGTLPKGQKRDAFALHLLPESKTYLGFWLNQIYRSTEGHVLIRVLPGGRQYWVGVLDDTNPTLTVKRWHGPYMSR
ncbi:ComEC/Rec2 family competence protein [Fibrella sp. WM1]|uniref:ComEC/Rec2 family competence protein n=1 Tax=Fibrella musci TaxID=3242485 RepID=UPI0035212269